MPLTLPIRRDIDGSRKKGKLSVFFQVLNFLILNFLVPFFCKKNIKSYTFAKMN